MTIRLCKYKSSTKINDWLKQHYYICDKVKCIADIDGRYIIDFYNGYSISCDKKDVVFEFVNEQ